MQSSAFPHLYNLPFGEGRACPRRWADHRVASPASIPTSPLDQFACLQLTHQPPTADVSRGRLGRSKTIGDGGCSDLHFILLLLLIGILEGVAAALPSHGLSLLHS